MKNTYYVTVGQRYRYEKHPLGLDPDGWLEVVASNYESAHAAVKKACGSKWANLYTAKNFESDKLLYKRGCMARIEANPPAASAPTSTPASPTPPKP